MSLTKKVGNASFIMLARKVWSGLISFFILAYLARTLNKEDFGIVAISSLVINFAQLLASSGVSEFIIYKKSDREDDYVNSSFWINLLLSSLVSLICILIAPVYAKYQNDERISTIIILLAVGFFFNMQSAIPTALFRKQLDYKKFTLIQSIFGTISLILQAFFAFLGFGVYSLALPNVIVMPLLAIVLFKYSSFKPKFSFYLDIWKEVFNYSKFVFGQKVFGRVLSEADKFFVGKFYGLKLLGVYNMAFQFSQIFVGHLMPIIVNLAMPIFALSNNDRSKLKEYIFKISEILAFLVFPVMIAMIIGADFFITVIYGSKWSEAVLPFQILSMFFIVKTIGSPISTVLNATGKQKLGFYFSMFASLFFIVAIIILGRNFPFLYFIIGLVLIRTFENIILIKICLSLVEVKLVEYLDLFKNQAKIFVFILTVLFSLNYFLSLSSFIQFLFFTFSYLFCVYLFRSSFKSPILLIESLLPEKIKPIYNRILL